MLTVSFWNYKCAYQKLLEAPLIRNGGTEQVIEGRVAVMECQASGEPQPLVTWQRNGIRVETGLRYIVEENVIHLKIHDGLK